MDHINTYHLPPGFSESQAPRSTNHYSLFEEQNQHYNAFDFLNLIDDTGSSKVNFDNVPHSFVNASSKYQPPHMKNNKGYKSTNGSCTNSKSKFNSTYQKKGKQAPFPKKGKVTKFTPKSYTKKSGYSSPKGQKPRMNNGNKKSPQNEQISKPLKKSISKPANNKYTSVKIIKVFHEKVSSKVTPITDLNWINDPSYEKITKIGIKDIELNCSLNMNKLQHLSFVKILKIINCKINGEIPSFLSNLPYITKIDLSNNQLTGKIPESFSSMYHLKLLKLSDNKLEGKIFDTQNLCMLEIFDVSNNNLTGKIPDDMADKPKLIIFNVKGNEMCGNIPQNLGLLPKLKHLDLSNNSFCGQIPQKWYHHNDQEGIFYIDLSQNYFTGELPKNTVAWKDLKVLSLSNNNLCGELSVDFSLWKNVYLIKLSHNQFKLNNDIVLKKCFGSLSNTNNIVIDLSYNDFSVCAMSNKKANIKNIISMSDIIDEEKKIINVVQYELLNANNVDILVEA